jgi:hypothetical protein
MPAVPRADAIGAPERRRLPAAAAARAAGILVVAAALALLAVRVPATFRAFWDGAQTAATRGQLGGALAGADSLDIDNPFVTAAVQSVPAGARYALLLPEPRVAESVYHLDPLTVQGLPLFMVEVLLPRVPVSRPRAGDYVLCYVCDTSPWDGRTHWLWTDGKGHAVGEVLR